jgi:hypothetical protein
MTRGITRTWLLLGCLLLGPPLAAEELKLRFEPLPLDPESPGKTRFGKLTYRGGIELGPERPHQGFGEISGLLVSPDGRRILAVQDIGWWLTAELRYDGAGNLAGIDGAEVAPILGSDGSALAGRQADAEGLTLPAGEPFGGDVLVSFERDHRVARYPLGSDGFAARPRPIPMPEALREAPANGSLEGIVSLPDGRLLAVTERQLDDDANLVGWLVEGTRFHRLALRRDGLYSVTDLAVLPGGDVLALERLYLPGLGSSMQIRRIPGSTIAPGAVLHGEVLIRLAGNHNIDNMEGLAVRSAGDVLLLYVISDDNRDRRQRTVLLMFSLPAEAPSPGPASDPEEGAPPPRQDHP